MAAESVVPTDVIVDAVALTNSEMGSEQTRRYNLSSYFSTEWITSGQDEAH